MSEVIIVNFYFGDYRIPTARMVEDVCSHFTNKNSYKIFSSGAYYKNLSNDYNKYSDNIVRSFTIKNFVLINKFIFYISLISHMYRNNYQKCVLLTDPPFLVVLAPLLKLFKPKLVITYWTMDLYPEALYASNIFPFSYKFFYKFCSFIKNRALKSVDKIINLSNCQSKLFKKYSSFKNINAKIISPWDLRNMKINNLNMEKFVKKTKFLERKVILYAGNIGRAHSVETIVNLINYCEENNKNNFFFLFACTGKKRPYLETILKNNKNTLIRDYFSEVETPYLFKSIFCHLITLEDGWEGIVFPSKLFGIIKSSKPTLYIGPDKSDIANLINANKLGLSFNNGDKPEKIFEALEKLPENTNNLKNNKIDFDENPQKVFRFIMDK